jgi:hypothetical protein
VPSLAVPSATADPVAHADWLELKAIGARDRNSSVADLTSELRRTGSAEELEDEGQAEESNDRGGETIEPVAESAFQEIEDRNIACDGAYPFELGPSHLQLRPYSQGSAYLFLLLLSRFGIGVAPAGLNAAQLFEEVSAVALADYLGGEENEVETLQFGFPRRLAPSGFKAAVENLCERIGEGEGPRDRPKRSDQKDASLDLLAWRPFADGRRSMVMTWGQCATGGDWHDKLTEMHPDPWCALWLRERPAVLPLRAFFVPRRVELDRWDVAAYKGGILFDRCRIAALAEPLLPLELRRKCRAFSRHVIKEEISR